MQETPIPQPLKSKINRSTRRRSSIQTQLIIVVGSVLFMATLIAVIGYVSLNRLQTMVQTNFQDANQIRELSLKIQNEFLAARQNEAQLLTSWRTTGLDVAASVEVTSNENHIKQAQTELDQIDQLVKASQDPSIQSTTAEINILRPKLNAYASGFGVTVNTIRELSREGGAFDQVDAEMVALEDGIDPQIHPILGEQLYQVKADKATYESSRRQADANTFTTSATKLMNMLSAAEQNDLRRGTEETPSSLVVHTQTLMFAFDHMVALENNATANNSAFNKITTDINQSIGRVTLSSQSGLRHADESLQALTEQTRLILIVTALLALALGVVTATLMGRGIILPVNQLGQAAEEIGKGNLDQSVEINGAAELMTLANAFNTMASQLKQTLSGLEQRVAERTQELERRSAQLQVAAEVARDTTSIRELDVLLNRAVNLIRDRYGFYHAGIFLVDNRGEYAVLRAATGEAGRAMLQRNHRLKIGEIGIVGYVGSTGNPRISLDVGSDAVHFRNPLLPETRSEMGLPLKSGDKVIGVLDVQSKEPAAFQQEDINVLQTMADQIAVAIDNARLLEEAQDNLKQLQAIHGRYSEEAWGNLGKVRNVLGYQYDPTGLTPLRSRNGNGNGNGHESETLSEEAQPAAVQLPIRLRGQDIAYLEVWTEDGRVSEVDRGLLESVSDRISQAMESARLYEEARTLAQHEQFLSQVTAQFTRSVGLEALLQSAVKKLGELPNVTDASIFLVGMSESPSSDLPEEPSLSTTEQ